MYDLLGFPMGFLGGLMLYFLFEGRSRRKATVELPQQKRLSDAESSIRIVEMTHTNNNYAPLENTFLELSMAEAQTILGKELRM